MIQKRNISTFAIGLCLLALMLLSASPAKAFKTSDPSMMEAYDSCLNGKYNGKAKKVKECFKQFKVTFSSACLVDLKGHWGGWEWAQWVGDTCRR